MRSFTRQVLARKAAAKEVSQDPLSHSLVEGPTEADHGPARLNRSPGHATIGETEPSSVSRMATRGHNFGLLSLRGLQGKFAISQSSDPLEQEADRIADQVVGTAQTERDGVASDVSRPAMTQLVAKSADTDVGSTDVDLMVNSTISTGGTPLSMATRRFMEPRFGHDFSQVRVHTDEAASRSAQIMQARAYTVADDIVFAAGKYAPGTQDGDRLLAHELTHVLQQTGGEPAEAARQDATTASDAPVIQREEDKGGGVTTEAPAAKHTFTSPELKTPDLDLEYVKGKYVLSGSVDYEVTQPASSGGEKQGEGPGTKLKSSGGVAASLEAPKYQAEVQAEFEKHTTDLLGQITPKVKLGAEAGADKSKLGVEFSVEGQTFEPKFAMNFLEFNAKEEKPFTFFNLEAAFDWKIHEWLFTTSDGANVKITPKVTPKLVIEPNYVKLGQWLAREAVFDAAMDFAVLGVGVATIAATAYEMAYAAEEGQQEMQAALQAKADIISYCKAYDTVMKGFDLPAGSRAAEGGAAAKQVLASRANVGLPREAISAAARQSGRDFALDVYPALRQQTRQELIRKWDSEHKVKAFLVSLVSGEGGGPLVSYFDQLVPAERMPTE